MIVMSPRVNHELVVSCPQCSALGIPAGIVKRAMSLCLLLPFFMMLLLGVATGGYIVFAMLSDNAVSGGFLLLGAILIGVGGYGAWRTSKTIIRLCHPLCVMALRRDQRSGISVLEGDV